MDCFTNAAKRKKRKTRKCLDEMRKRSRTVSQMLKDDNKHDELYSENTRNNMITEKRITLKMFPKAIQSTTITRPALLDLQHKQNLNLDDIVRGTRQAKPHNGAGATISVSGCSKECETIDEKLNSENQDPQNALINAEADGKDTEASLELFSSMDELTDQSPNSRGTGSVPVATSSSTQSLRDAHAYSLYEQFMAEVPLCVQLNTRLCQEDVMKNSKMILQNLFIQSYKGCDDNIIGCIRNDTPKSPCYPAPEAAQDPLSYIRQSVIGQSPVGRVSDSVTGSSSCAQSPLLSPSSSGPSSDAPLSVVRDTPDYSYYPHKLM